MKYYEYVEPGEDNIPEYNILSEDEILKKFNDYCCLMYITRLGYLPSKDQIIKDWCTIHWATEIGEVT